MSAKIDITKNLYICYSKKIKWDWAFITTDGWKPQIHWNLGYWETNDEEKMKAQFQKYGMLIDNFSLAIEILPIQKNEDLIAYLERMMKKVDDLQKGEQSKE